MEREALEQKRMLSFYRHDWMNDVQILLGYLSLNKYDQIKQYLKRQVEKANEERLITQLTYGPLVMYLVTLPQRYKQWKINVKVANIADYSLSTEKRMFKVIQIFFSWLDSNLQCLSTKDIELSLYLSKEEEWMLVINICEVATCKEINLMNEVEGLRKNIKKYDRNVTVSQENGQIRLILS